MNSLKSFFGEGTNMFSMMSSMPEFATMTEGASANLRALSAACKAACTAAIVQSLLQRTSASFALLHVCSRSDTVHNSNNGASNY